MAKVIYTGISSKARKIKTCYVGVSSKARKITKAYVGVNNVARLCYASDLFPAGTYWLIDSTGTKCYSKTGTLLSSNSNNTSWVVPETGTYTLELHGTGGTGGDGVFQQYGVSQSGRFMYTVNASSGGGGGGSGALSPNLNFTKDTSYSVTISTSVSMTTKFGSYTIYSGGNGNSNSSSGPYGGSASTVSGWTKRSTDGGRGEGDYRTSYGYPSSVAAMTGGSGGSGGSSIGTYGNGGAGGSTPAFSSATSGSVSGEAGVAGCVIIRRIT